MRIMQVIPYFCFGGAETMCENLTYALTALGHSVTVVSLYKERTPIAQRMEAAGVKILYLDKKLGLDLSMVSKLMEIMKREKPDVVHTHLNVIKYAVTAAKLCGIKHCVHTVHNVAAEEAENRQQKLISTVFFKLGWSIPVALSPEVRNTIVSFYGLKEEKVPMIYNGVDLGKCLTKTAYELSDPAVVLHVGRFNEQKNHKGLLDAFANILKTHPNCSLKLIGDGELLEETQQYADSLGIREKVLFLGSQTNIYPYLQEADVFLLPSKYEGMPMTIIEAMGTGLPVVATAVGGVPDMLTHQESGLLVANQPEVIADAVCTLLESRELRQTLGRAAKTESEKFSAQYMAQAYSEVYKS